MTVSTGPPPTNPDTVFETARVADAMSHALVSCTPETPLVGVAALMSRRRIHAVYVFDYGDDADVSPELWGLVSDLDLVAAARAGLAGRTAAGSAVEPLVTVMSDDRLEHAAQLMAEHGTSHLAVLDSRTHRPAGVISTLDIARLLAESADCGSS
ncbi:MAG TPA: CBS domain-containing protein [Gaiellaceae bacterium]